jgi:hypothetical protein
MFNECLQDLPIRHLLDVMHVEWNICDNLLKYVFGEKYTVNVRKDMQEEGLCNCGINLVGPHVSNLMHYMFSHTMKKNIS